MKILKSVEGINILNGDIDAILGVRLRLFVLRVRAEGSHLAVSFKTKFWGKKISFRKKKIHVNR